MINSISPKSSDRENYEPSWASDRQTLTSCNSQDACDQPRHSKGYEHIEEQSLFDALGVLLSSGRSIDSGFGGCPFIPPVKKPIKGGEVPSQAQRTLSAGEADQPKIKSPKKKALSFPAFGSSSPSLAQVRSPFGQGNSPKKPSW